jgi:CubicO group peptidase (beta-lactamase class C family)
MLKKVGILYKKSAAKKEIINEVRNMKIQHEYIEKLENGLREEYFLKGDNLKSITEAMREACIPGIEIAIINDFEIVLTKGYGTQDIELEPPVNKNTIFQAASISKPLTALAVMKLVQDGKFDLDEDINTYLKTWKLPESKLTEVNKVTLRNLLSHTAGVTVHGFPGYSPEAEIPTLVQILNGETPANTGKIYVDLEPNTQFRYSGGGYTIVQQALIDQLQKPFEEIMHELVLEPLGMTNSFYSKSPLNEQQAANATAGHKSDGSQVPHKRHLYPEMAAAGLWTTAEDLAKFAIEVQKCLKGESNKILTREFMEMMITPVLSGEYNLGLRNEKIGREMLLGHSGGNEGYSCNMTFHKENGFGVIFMSNSDNGYKIKMPIFRSAAATYGFQNILLPDYEIAQLSVEVMGAFEGSFKIQADKTLKIFQHNGKLHYKTIFNEPIQLEYVGNNTMIDISRNTKFEIIIGSSNLLMNENIIERLDEGEKLASDYIEEGNIEQTIKCYSELMERDVNLKLRLENALNNDGYNCISRKNFKTAIDFLKINTILFPESYNAWDSLGEAYFINKQYDFCIEAMKRSLNYNPNNKNASKLIKDSEVYLEK